MPHGLTGAPILTEYQISLTFPSYHGACGGIARYLTAVELALSPIKAVVFISVQQGLFGVFLSCCFAPNHKGMSLLDTATRTDFLHRQVLTSRNIHGGWLTDFLLGGLNYQIEHHLFPSMPRPNLRQAQVVVMAFCQTHGLPYCQTSLGVSYAHVLRHLKTLLVNSGVNRDLRGVARPFGILWSA